ncbi:MAG TPA: TRAP transporter large permease, partial [Arenibaculum sp.]|nr:TRAP transporter large permease [Arenibaculum sp.]
AVLIPAMKKAGYPAPFSVAITAASSTLGIVIPPSILMVIYGAFGNLSIGALFLGGIVPGLLIGLSQMAYTYVVARRFDIINPTRRSLPEMGSAVVRAVPPLALPVVILGGITGGIFTATEAAAIAVVFGLLLALVVYRHLKPRQLPGLLAESVVAYSLPMFAVAAAGIMGWLISYLGIAREVSAFILGITADPTGIFLLIVGFLLVIGTVLSPVTAVIIFLPIVQNLGTIAGLDQIHLGIVVVLSLALGLITPPYGICLLIASQIGDVSTPQAFLAVLPLVALVLVIIVAGILVPDLFLFLPRTFVPNAFPGG